MFYTSDKTWGFDQSERTQGPIYITKIKKHLEWDSRNLGAAASSWLTSDCLVFPEKPKLWQRIPEKYLQRKKERV